MFQVPSTIIGCCFFHGALLFLHTVRFDMLYIQTPLQLQNVIHPFPKLYSQNTHLSTSDQYNVLHLPKDPAPLPDYLYEQLHDHSDIPVSSRKPTTPLTGPPPRPPVYHKWHTTVLHAAFFFLETVNSKVISKAIRVSAPQRKSVCDPLEVELSTLHPLLIFWTGHAVHPFATTIPRLGVSVFFSYILTPSTFRQASP